MVDEGPRTFLAQFLNDKAPEAGGVPTAACALKHLCTFLDFSVLWLFVMLSLISQHIFNNLGQVLHTVPAPILLEDKANALAVQKYGVCSASGESLCDSMCKIICASFQSLVKFKYLYFHQVRMIAG